MFKQPTRIITDIFFLIIICLVGWALIGHYAQGELLSTGYQDWLSHAFRIRELESHGLSSWNFRWANGLPIWRSYQFAPHYLALFVHELFNVSILKAMIYVVVAVFISIRVMTYLFLRKLGVGQFAAFAAVIFSYDFLQQWQVIKDYSIFVATGVIPIYLYLWIHSIRNAKLDYVLAVMSATLWFLHPVIGFMSSFIFGVKKMFELKLTSKRKLLSITAIYVLFFSTFAIPVITSNYFSNPIFKSTQFIILNTPYDYLGTSLIYYILVVGMLFTYLFMRSSIPRWAKLLFISCIFTAGLVVLGRAGYTPQFLNQFQIGRLNTSVAFMLPFVIAPGLNAIFIKTKSNFAISIVLIALVGSVFSAIEGGSANSAGVTTNRITPISSYLEQTKKIVNTRIYYPNESEGAFYSTDDITFVGSYATHQLPSPLSFRYGNIMQSKYSLTTVSDYRKKLIYSYSNLLGVKYLFIPINSQYVRKFDEDGVFQKIDVAEANSQAYFVYENTAKLSDAYLIPSDHIRPYRKLEYPTIESRTYAPWDEEVLTMSDKLQSSRALPVVVRYDSTNKIFIRLPDEFDVNSILYLNQSYDPGWRIVGSKDAYISRSTLNQMIVKFDRSPQEGAIVLEHSWSRWYIALLIVGSVGLFISVIGGLIYILVHKK